MERDLPSDRFMELDAGDDDALLIQRIDSNEIIYCPPKRKYKVNYRPTLWFKPGIRFVFVELMGDSICCGGRDCRISECGVVLVV